MSKYSKEFLIEKAELVLDKLFMAVLFLAWAGYTYDKKEWIEEANYQIQLHVKYLYDKESGLLHHGWSFIRKDNFSGVFWNRGNSWFTYGVLELMDILKQYTDTPWKRMLTDTFCAQVKALEALQAESGLWHTILNDESSYEEVSGTAAIAAGLFKAILSGAGSLGLGMVTYARLRNPAKLIVLDMQDSRLEKAKEFGADIVWNPSKIDVVKEIMELTGGYGCDTYIEATGHPSSVVQGMQRNCRRQIKDRSGGFFRIFH